MTLTARQVAGGIGLGLATTYAHRRTARRVLVRQFKPDSTGPVRRRQRRSSQRMTTRMRMSARSPLAAGATVRHAVRPSLLHRLLRRVVAAAAGVLGGPHLGEARCPLCTCSVVRLSPGFSAARRGGLSRLRTIVLYNVGATVTRRLRLTRRCLDAVRLVLERAALCAYAATGVAWEAARVELHNSLVRVPSPADERVRFFCAWQIRLAFGQHLDLPMLQWVASLVLKLMAMQRDCRHALLVLDEAHLGADAILHLCVTGAWCRLANLTLRLVHPRLPEGLHAHAARAARPRPARPARRHRRALHLRPARWPARAAHARALAPPARAAARARALRAARVRRGRWSSRRAASAASGRRACSPRRTTAATPTWCTPTEVPWETPAAPRRAPARHAGSHGLRFIAEVLPDWAVADLWKVPPVV